MGRCNPDSLLCSTHSEAAWLVTQEAAKQCLALRMRLHWGNPTQSFAALEQMLQGLAARLAGEETDEAAAAAKADAHAKHKKAADAQVGSFGLL